MYAFRRDILTAVTKLESSPLEIAESLEQLRWIENGYRITAGITEFESNGIDTPEDLAKAIEKLVRSKKRKFTFPACDQYRLMQKKAPVGETGA